MGCIQYYLGIYHLLMIRIVNFTRLQGKDYLLSIGQEKKLCSGNIN